MSLGGGTRDDSTSPGRDVGGVDKEGTSPMFGRREIPEIDGAYDDDEVEGGLLLTEDRG